METVEKKFVSLKLPVEIVTRIETLARENNRSRSNQIMVLLLSALSGHDPNVGQHLPK